MIYFKKDKTWNFRIGIYYRMYMKRVSNIDIIPHHFIIFRAGYNRFYIGHNRLKRIERDRLYELDGKLIKYKNGMNGKGVKNGRTNESKSKTK